MKMTQRGKKPDPVEEAILWQERIESGRLAGADKGAFEAWLSADAAHERMLAEAAAVSAGVRQVGQNALDADGLKNSALGASIYETAALAYQAPSSNMLRRKIVSVAALFLVLVLGFWSVVEAPVKDSPVTHVAAVGEQRSVLLSDGSVMMLNTGAEVSVAMTNEIRRLHLVSGEVYFEVAKDQARPFEVAVGSSIVRAIGTAFNIKRQETNSHADVTILVTEGTVAVKVAPSQEDSEAVEGRIAAQETLTVGEQLVVTGAKLQRTRLDNVVVNQKIQWRQGKIRLHQITLAEIVDRIQPYIPEKIIIADESVGAMVAGGLFEVGKVQSFFDALEVALPVKVVREDGVIVLRRVRQTAVFNGFKNQNKKNQP